MNAHKINPIATPYLINSLKYIQFLIFISSMFYYSALKFYRFSFLFFSTLLLVKPERINYRIWHLVIVCLIYVTILICRWHSLLHVNILIILGICTNTPFPFLFFPDNDLNIAKCAKIWTFLRLVIMCLWDMRKLDRKQIRLRLITFSTIPHKRTYIYTLPFSRYAHFSRPKI